MWSASSVNVTRFNPRQRAATSGHNATKHTAMAATNGSTVAPASNEAIHFATNHIPHPRNTPGRPHLISGVRSAEMTRGLPGTPPAYRDLDGGGAIAAEGIARQRLAVQHAAP